MWTTRGENESVEKKKKKPTNKQKNAGNTGQYVACPLQENMFSQETYGCTSWTSSIVLVISGFMFVSLLYWIARFLFTQCLFLLFLFIATEKCICRLLTHNQNM